MEGKAGFTGVRDVDREILLRESDNEILKTCSLNSYFASLCDEDFYWRRSQRSFPKLFVEQQKQEQEKQQKQEQEKQQKQEQEKQQKQEQEGKGGETKWKDFYLKNMFYINKLKEQYNFNYDRNSNVSAEFVYKNIVNLINLALTNANTYFPLFKTIFDTVKDIYNKYGEFMYVEYVVQSLKKRNSEFFAINKTFFDIYKFYTDNKFKSSIP